MVALVRAAVGSGAAGVDGRRRARPSRAYPSYYERTATRTTFQLFFNALNLVLNDRPRPSG